MLLALDVGNTNITIGVFEGGVMIDHRRLRTVRDQTAD
jgi:pantothenate kinase type III